MILAQGPQHSDAGEAQTHGLSVSSQALYHWATALPCSGIFLPFWSQGQGPVEFGGKAFRTSNWEN